MISRSISPSENARSLERSSTCSTPSDRVAIRERHRHQALRHVARALGRLPGEARILLEVVDHDRLAGDEHPAGDSRARGNPHPDQVAFTLARDGLEDELVRRVVEQEDRRRLGAEDRPRDIDDRLQQRAMALLRGEHPGRDGLLVARAVRHVLPPAFDAVK